MLPRFSTKVLALFLALVIPLAATAANPLWIDVRSASEFDTGHVSDALNIPYNEIAEGIKMLDVDKDAVIYVYCRSGRRSGIAKETLEGMGYSGVVNIGGFEDALKKANQETGR